MFVADLKKMLEKCDPNAVVYFGKVDLTGAYVPDRKKITTIYEQRAMNTGESRIVLASEEE